MEGVKARVISRLTRPSRDLQSTMLKCLPVQKKKLGLSSWLPFLVALASYQGRRTMEWLELDARLEEKRRAVARRQQREAARRRREEETRRQEQERLAARCREMAAEDVLSERLEAWCVAEEQRRRAEQRREADARLFQQVAAACRRAKELGVPLSTPGASSEERLCLLNARIEAKEAASMSAQAAKQRLDELPHKRAKIKLAMRRFFASSARKKMENAVFSRACARFLPLLEPTSDLADNKAASLLNHESQNGLTPVLAAIFEGELTILRRLLHLGASSNYETRAGMTPLMAAVMAGDVIAVSVLVEFNADLDYETAGGVTPLLLAADKGRTPVVRALLELGANADATNKSGRSALIQATMSGHYDTLRVLLAHGVDKSVRDSSGWSAVEWAQQLKNTAVQSLLSSSITSQALKAQLKAEDAASETDVHTTASTHYASQRKRWQMLERFMKERSLSKVGELLAAESSFLSPNYEDTTGTTPLMLSCSIGTSEEVLLFLERNCIATHQNRDGVTALMLACKRGDTTIIGLLMKAGCSLLTRDFSGHDSLFYLNTNEHPALAELLTSANRNAGTQPPLVCLGAPMVSMELLRRDHNIDRIKVELVVFSDDDGDDKPSSASPTDRNSRDGPQTDSGSDGPVENPDICRWAARQRVLKKNRQRREQFDNERQKILAAAARGRRNGLVAPLPGDPKGRWKYPICNNCKRSKARKRCFSCEQVLCDKCHARLHEMAHRRHHTYEEVNPELFVGNRLQREVQEKNEESFEALVARSRGCITSIRAVLSDESPQQPSTFTPPNPEVEKYMLKKRVEREKEVMRMQINIPVAAAKQAAIYDEAAIFAEPAELELAKLYVLQKKYEKARAVFQQAQKVVENAVGILHPTMLKIAIGISRIDQVLVSIIATVIESRKSDGYGGNLQETGQSAKCAIEMERAVTVFESVLAPDNQDFLEAIGLLLMSLVRTVLDRIARQKEM